MQARIAPGPDLQPDAGASAGRPFVGRTQERAELAAHIGDASSGRGSLVLLVGEPGIGKTRLMTELAALALRRGMCVVSGRCWEEGGAPPFWPWIQVLRSLGGDLERLAAPEETRRPGSAHVTPEGERIRLFDDVGRFLAAAASEQPLLVTLDDIHAADEASLRLLHFLGGGLADARILVVASYRDQERRVREHADLFAELTRAGRRIALRGFSAAEIEAYVAATGKSDVGPELVARLREITAGNPFFLGEVVRLLAADDSLARLDGGLQDPALRIPEEVRVLIRRRIATLSPESVFVLRVAAVLGREFDLHLLQRIGALSMGALLEALAAAVAAGVVTASPATPHHYAFTHELVRETLYDDLPPGRRMELHQAVGRLLARVHSEDLDPHLSEVARHLYLAAPLGDADEALELLVAAGNRSSAVFAYEEAAVHHRRALELLALTGDATGARRCRLLLNLGDVQWRSGDSAGARRTFEEAIEAARRLPDAELLALGALGYVTALGGFLLYARFEVGGTGVGLLEEALAALPAVDGSLRAQLLAHLALEMWSADEPVARRVAVSEAAIEMARRLGDSESLATALHARHWALTTPGMARERLAHTEEMLGLAKETVNPEIEFLAHNARFHCFLELCDRRGMDAEAQAMTELADRLRQPFYRWHTTSLRALRATLDGRCEDAERLADQALELGSMRQSEYATYVFRYAQMFAVRWAQWRLHELWPEIADHGERYPWIPRWRDALAAAELGDAEGARAELERHAARNFADLPRDGLWLLHLSALAEACVETGDPRYAHRIYELLLPHADDNAISYTQQPFGPIALRLGKLAALLGDHKAMDRHFAAALARAELLGARAIRARVLLEHARAIAARGEPADRRRCVAMLDEVVQLGGELDAPALTARAEALRDGVVAPRDDRAMFRREGDIWTIAYGSRGCRLRDVKGLRYIACLLANPGRELHVLELAGGPGDVPAYARVSWTSDGGAVLDERAKAQYRERLAEVEEDLREAEGWADVERAARLVDERDALAEELARAVGLRGRDRGFSSPAERARISVTKAIRAAIRRIDEHAPELAEHLEASIQTGRFCSYAPPGAVPPDWSL